jgi:hypothetical protein
MDDFEEKLNSILANPQMMQQIMSMAQAFNQSAPPKQEEPKQDSPKIPAQPLGLDPAMLQRLMGIMRQSGIDKNQQNLLRALGPYLSRERIIKLEKAMRSAKIAAIAASMLRSSGIPLYSGR